MKILILNDGSKYENWGIKACIDGLEVMLETAFPDATYERLDHDFMHQRFGWEPKIFGRKLFEEHLAAVQAKFEEDPSALLEAQKAGVAAETRARVATELE